jgi:hypothetical protein
MKNTDEFDEATFAEVRAAIEAGTRLAKNTRLRAKIEEGIKMEIPEESSSFSALWFRPTRAGGFAAGEQKPLEPAEPDQSGSDHCLLLVNGGNEGYTLNAWRSSATKLSIDIVVGGDPNGRYEVSICAGKGVENFVLNATDGKLIPPDVNFVEKVKGTSFADLRNIASADAQELYEVNNFLVVVAVKPALD